MKNKIILKTVVGILFIMGLGSVAFPFWLANRSGDGFGDAGLSSTTVNLEDYVVAGAGYFLDSYAQTLQFMRKLELGGENSVKDTEPALLLGAALKNMEQANKTYLELKRLAESTPYNQPVIDALLTFDFENFRAAFNIEDKNFDRARDYLGKGDIRSVYGALVGDTDTILKQLKQVKAQVDAGNFPSTLDVWQLDRTYSDTARFGQYVSRIFDALHTAINR